VSEGFFLGLQSDYDLMERRRQIEAELAAIPRSGMKTKLIYLSLHPIAKQARDFMFAAKEQGYGR